MWFKTESGAIFRCDSSSASHLQHDAVFLDLDSGEHIVRIDQQSNHQPEPKLSQHDYVCHQQRKTSQLSSEFSSVSESLSATATRTGRTTGTEHRTKQPPVKLICLGELSFDQLTGILTVALFEDWRQCRSKLLRPVLNLRLCHLYKTLAQREAQQSFQSTSKKAFLQGEYELDQLLQNATEEVKQEYHSIQYKLRCGMEAEMVRWSYDMYTYAKGKLEARTKELLALADRKRDTRLGQYTEERDALLKTLQTQQDSIYEQHKDFHQTHFKQLDHNVSKEQEGYSGETEGNPFFREQICSRYDCRAAYVPSLLTTKERCRVDDCTFWSQNCGCGLNHCCSDPYSLSERSLFCAPITVCSAMHAVKVVARLAKELAENAKSCFAGVVPSIKGSQTHVTFMFLP